MPKLIDDNPYYYLHKRQQKYRKNISIPNPISSPLDEEYQKTIPVYKTIQDYLDANNNQLP